MLFIRSNKKSVQSSYVAQTKRALGDRIQEHQRDVRLKKDSVIADHCNINNHKMAWNEVKMLDREYNWYRRSISKMINMEKQFSPLNVIEETQMLPQCYKNLTRKFYF